MDFAHTPKMREMQSHLQVFIDRHILIEEFGSNGHVPLWHSFMFARELMSAGFDINPSGRIFTLIAAVLAGIVGYKETRAPSRTDNFAIHP